MVEPPRDYFTARPRTPTPTRPGSQIEDAQQLRQERDFSTSPLPSPCISHPPFPIQSGSRTIVPQHPADYFSSVMSNTEGDRHSPSRPREGSTTDRSQQQQIHAQPHPGRMTYASFHPPPFSASPSQLPSDGLGGTVHHQSAPTVYYDPRSGYSPQNYPLLPPTGSTISHEQHFVGYPSSFHDPRAIETAMVSENPHIRYQPMIQPHVPVYYQPHASAPIHGPYQPIHHYPPVSPSHYSIPVSPFPSSPPIYPPYPSHQPADTQGAWYYLPHPPPRHAEGTAVHRTQYSPYPSITTPQIDKNSPASPTSQEFGASRRPVPQEFLPTDRPRSGSLHRPSSVLPPSLEAVDGSSPDIGRRQDKPMVRKPYHPNPPPHRSEWVMWVGNIPSDATHDELWKFFNKALAHSLPAGNSTASHSLADKRRENGVISIFLISKSSCVFVNYESEENLFRAVERFNGKPLRPHDPRCLRLVCRVRKKDDDLKAGVGGQRGQGLHTKWIKDRKSKGNYTPADAAPLSEIVQSHSQASGSSGLDSVDQLTAQTSDLALSSDDEGRHRFHSSHRNSSGSFTSTDSSLLSTFFPKRYFILKSLTQYDLDLSARYGLWATQKHNEGVLDQAYRTSTDVYLIFGVNKSGEFYGYARMAGPVQHGTKNVLWASRTKDSMGVSRTSHSPSRGSLDPASQSTSSIPNLTQPTSITPVALSEEDDNWADVKTPGPRKDLSSAPAQLGKPHRQHSTGNPPAKSMTLPGGKAIFELDPRAPMRAVRTARSGDALAPNSSLVIAEDEDDHDGDARPQRGETDAWGDCFKVEWLCTERLPFYWTRNLRNPWNHDREVKISRDGTELEPTVGGMLLTAWEVMKVEGGEIPSTTADNNVGSAKRIGQVRRQSTRGKSATEMRHDCQGHDDVYDGDGRIH